MRMSNTPNRSSVIHPIILAILIQLVWFSVGFSAEIPTLKGRVNDYASMLSSQTEQKLNAMLMELEQTDSTQIVILTVNSLEGKSVGEYALEVAEKWKLGQKDIDNGALLLISKNDRKIRIEVGYGLEGTLTDLISGRIIDSIITPSFKKGAFDAGVIAGVDAMVKVVKGEYSAENFTKKKSKGDPGGLVGFLIFFFFFIGRIISGNKALAAIVGGVAAPLFGFLFVGFSIPLLVALSFIGLIGGIVASSMFAASALTGSRRGSGWTTGGYGGGFGSSGGSFGGGFSGGGGGFGGGGASGGW